MLRFLDHFNIPEMCSGPSMLHAMHAFCIEPCFSAVVWCFPKSVTGHVNRISIFPINRRTTTRPNFTSIVTYCFLNAGAMAVRAWARRICFSSFWIGHVQLFFGIPAPEFMFQYSSKKTYFIFESLRKSPVRSSWADVIVWAEKTMENNWFILAVARIELT